MMNKIDIIKEKILKSNYTAIVCHQNPDGDTLGSAFALSETLSLLGKKNDVLCADELPTKFNFMDEIKLLHCYDKSKYDLTIFLDSGDIKLTGTLFSDTSIDDIDTINLDHHGTNSKYAKLNYVDSTYSSAAELVLELIRIMGIIPSKKIAEYLYVGMVTDTGQFAYSYTSARTHNNAAYLIECGADFSKIHYDIFKSMPLQRLLLMKHMLDNMKLSRQNSVAVSILTLDDYKACGATAQDSDSLVNSMLAVESVLAAVFVRQVDEKTFKASFRSMDGIDISVAAKSLGGGGHKQAAGATFPAKKEEVLDIILEAVDKAEL
jgi:phosphoesterase RecJ-like protein